MATMPDLVLAAEIFKELDRANVKYDTRFHSLNEALGTLYAEFSELRQEIVSHGPSGRIRAEAVQVAAMAIKLIQFVDTEAQHGE